MPNPDAVGTEGEANQKALPGMTISFDLESLEGIAVCTAHGPLTLDEIKEAAATMWQIKGSKIRFLWDLRDARFDLDTAEIRGLAEFVKQLTPSAALRSAFVVSRTLEFGLIRMFEVFRETESARTAVFRERTQALAWLAQDVAQPDANRPG